MAGVKGEIEGDILAPGGWVRGRVAWDSDGTITAVDGEPAERPPEGEPRIVAGFVDLHVHGGGGGDAMAGEEGVRTMAREHARFGTAALAPTTMTAPPEAIGNALAGVEAVRRDPGEGEAAVLGAHLEGPFISAKRLGAQPDCVLPYDEGLVGSWLGTARLCVATIAPEIEGGRELLAHLASSGCRVQVGHSDATAEEAAAASRSGVSGFTHLYNAMSPFHHRKPGVVGHALAHAEHAELICDLEHVSVPALRIACGSIAKAYAVTDSTAAFGMPDGEHPLGTTTVTKSGSTMRTADGGLAGTAMSMLDARRNLVASGFEEELAQQMVSSRPAEYLGLEGLGSVEAGRRASLVRIVAGEADGVWIDGRRL